MIRPANSWMMKHGAVCLIALVAGVLLGISNAEAKTTVTREHQFSKEDLLEYLPGWLQSSDFGDMKVTETDKNKGIIKFVTKSKQEMTIQIESKGPNLSSVEISGSAWFSREPQKLAELVHSLITEVYKRGEENRKKREEESRVRKAAIEKKAEEEASRIQNIAKRLCEQLQSIPKAGYSAVSCNDKLSDAFIKFQTDVNDTVGKYPKAIDFSKELILLATRVVNYHKAICGAGALSEMPVLTMVDRKVGLDRLKQGARLLDALILAEETKEFRSDNKRAEDGMRKIAESYESAFMIEVDLWRKSLDMLR